MKLRRGFTLIELLTVLAIIALLAAITVPVFMRAKAEAARNADISDMNSLRSALQLYRVDQGAYPPALLGYVTLYSTGPNMGNVMPANEIKGFLYPRRLNSLETFKPSWNREGALVTTNAVYPTKDVRPVGSAALIDLDGDGAITNADDVSGARQAYGPTDGNVCANGTVAPCGPNGPANFYKISGYDVSEVKTSTGKRTEVRYALFWSTLGLTTGGADDDPRQLGYNEPPETTVITWNSGYREYGAGTTVLQAKKDHVLFLGGGARPYDSKLMADRSWRVLP